MYMDEVPKLHEVAFIAAVIGACLALAITGMVTASIWATESWDNALFVGARLLPLLLSVFVPTAVTCILVKFIRVNLEPGAQPEPKLPSTPAYDVPAQYDEIDSGELVERQKLAESIVGAAKLMIEWKYGDGRNPSRNAMCDETGMPQAIWNSAYDILKAIGLENYPSEIGLHGARAMLNRIVAEYDQIWLPNGQPGHSRSIQVLANPENNRYTVIP
jgi:hypothetical protein